MTNDWGKRYTDKIRFKQSLVVEKENWECLGLGVRHCDKAGFIT
jgi:hypothetical protein